MSLWICVKCEKTIHVSQLEKYGFHCPCGGGVVIVGEVKTIPIDGGATGHSTWEDVPLGSLDLGTNNMKQEIYCSDDYAGIDLGNRRAYFGYEQTKCVTHGTIDGDCPDEDCEDVQWCFVVRDKNEKELCRFTQSELTLEDSRLHTEETYGFLCVGIAKYLGL